MEPEWFYNTETGFLTQWNSIVYKSFTIVFVGENAVRMVVLLPSCVTVAVI